MKRPRDTNQLAKTVVDIATGQAEDTKPKATPKRANGGHARASSMSSERRQEIARAAASARWGHDNG
ncbi:MAG: histone H1 [Gammaproteobacteria bacterium]|nr:histone H1 [Gammaproteobacteria bacterium]